MTNTNETIADIIAEMRALSNPISDGIIAINGRSIADRLEAAYRREKAAIEADALAVGGIVEAAARAMGCCRKTISSVADGEHGRKTARGFKWTYANSTQMPCKEGGAK